VSFVKKGASAIGKLIIAIVLGLAFVSGLAGVVYMSLQGSEVRVPEIVGKNFEESERELESLGLRIKKRADRYSQEAPNTVLEQLPRPGDTVKTGQLILVVTSKPNPEGEEKPATLQKGNQDTKDDSETIEELISDKPKKRDANSNSNTNKKKSAATRDVIANSASNTSSQSGNSNESNSNKDKNETPGNKQGTPGSSPKPTPAKTPGGGDTRERRNPNN